jgi:hypothetical protein
MCGRNRNERSPDETPSSVLLQEGPLRICKIPCASFACISQKPLGMTTSEFRETLTARLHILVNDWLAEHI